MEEKLNNVTLEPNSPNEIFCLTQGISAEKIIKPNGVLSYKAKERLLSPALEITRSAFGTEIEEDDVKNHFYISPDILYLIRNNEKELIGYSSYREFLEDGIKILYLDGIAINPNYQRKGIFTMINNMQINSGQYDFFVMRTQNPVVYGATKSLENILSVFPNQESTKNSERLNFPKKIASYTSNILGMENYDSELLVGRGTYKRALYNPIPYHPIVSEFFKDKLKINYKNGDTVIIVSSVHNFPMRKTNGN